MRQWQKSSKEDNYRAVDTSKRVVYTDTRVLPTNNKTLAKLKSYEKLYYGICPTSRSNVKKFKDMVEDIKCYKQKPKNTNNDLPNYGHEPHSVEVMKSLSRNSPTKPNSNVEYGSFINVTTHISKGNRNIIDSKDYY